MGKTRYPSPKNLGKRAADPGTIFPHVSEYGDRPIASSETTIESAYSLLVSYSMKKTKVLARFIGFVNVAVLGMLFSLPAHAYTTPPACLDDNGSVIAVIDDQVVQWKTSEPNGQLLRAHISGPIVKLYPNQSGHAHFSVKIGTGPKDTLEVIYNLSFGAIAHVAVGMQVEACGDFINSYAPENGYQASPDGAIIHWIHKSDSQSHKGGFLEINGVLYGQGNGHGA